MLWQGSEMACPLPTHRSHENKLIVPCSHTFEKVNVIFKIILTFEDCPDVGLFFFQENMVLYFSISVQVVAYFCFLHCKFSFIK